MVSRYTHPHIDISERYIRRDFVAPRMNMSTNTPPRTREEHGVRLREQLQAAFQAFDFTHKPDPRLEEIDGVQGAFLEVELLRGTPIEKIERKGIRPTATHVQPDETRTVGWFVSDAARALLDQILLDYTTGPLTEKKKQPQRRGFVESIKAIREARFRTFYTDRDDNLPEDPTEPVWWEIWCARQAEEQLDAMVERMGGRSAEKDRRLYFPETVIVPVLASQQAIEHILFARFAITEIRRATDTPVVFLEADRDEQLDWVDNLAQRVRWPNIDVPAVCLLDTGVNRAHHLIEPALAERDMETVKGDWGLADDTKGHGTQMSGVALYGDLMPLLESNEELILKHRLESVKILPPPGFPPTKERFYGPVTQAAIVLPEIRQAGRLRVYCMAVSNESESGDQTSGWSGAIDQAASGSMIGDNNERKRRLIILSTGNAPNHIERDRLQSPDKYPIEDPGQAWNALTVGGYTDKIEIQDPGLEDYKPYSKPGDLSPHTRTSTNWSGKTPFKPDIVMEAGNRAVSPSGRDVLDAESLAVLSTGPDIGQQPLVPFRATSAAAAAAARMAARLMADHPNSWPETIRALMIHGAEWTKPMKDELANASNKSKRAALIRRYGYGVPTFERANASANDHLALVAQAEIQPFAYKGKRFKDSHFYKLPWPKDVIEAIGHETVRLKITLSYFIDPNPGYSANIDPYRYQSFGLRFDLKRRNESLKEFAKRVNASERNPGEKMENKTDTDNWFFGQNSVSAGSLHCDIWTGSAAKLLTRDMVCVHPVGGWWRNRANRDIRSQKTRYAIIVSLKTESTDIDLYTPIKTLIESEISTEISFKRDLEETTE